MRGSRTFKIFLGSFVALLLLMLAAAGTGAYLLGSSTGRQWLVSSLAPALLASTGYKLQVEGVDAPTLGEWRVQRFKLGQGEQPLIDIHQFHLQWTPEDLLDKRLTIHTLGAETVGFYLPPKSSAETQSKPRSLKQTLTPFPVTLDQFNIGSLQIHHPSLPAEQRYSLIGKLALRPQGIPLSLELDARTLSGVPMSASLKTRLDQNHSALIEGQLHEDAGGLIGQLTRQLPEQPLNVDLALNVTEQAGIYAVNIQRLTGHYRKNPISINGQAKADPQSQSLQGDLTLVIGQSKHSLKGSVQQQQIDLTTRLDAFPLALLSPWMAEPVTGTASANARITGSLDKPQVQGTLALNTKYRGLPWQVDASGSGSLSIIDIKEMRLSSGNARAQAKGRINLANKTLDTQIDSNTLPLALLQTLLPDTIPDYAQGTLTTNLNVQGTWSSPQVAGQAGFSGRIKGVPLDAFAKGQGHANHVELQQLRIDTEQQGQLTASGQYHAEQLDFSIRASALPSQILAGLGWQVQPGQLTANLDLKGTPKRPLVNGTLNLKTNFNRESADGEPLSVPLEVDATATTREEQLEVRAVVVESGETLGHVDLSAPLYRYLNLEQEQHIPLQGKVSTDLDLAYLRLLLDPDEHTTGGRLQTKIQLDGTLSAPRLKGQASLIDGRYENALSGTVLNQINVRIDFDQQNLIIREAKATDGGTGELEVSGAANWADRQQAIDLKLLVRDANILRRHDLEGVANGSLALTGNMQELTLAGTLDISPFTMYLDNLQSNSIPSLTVTEVDSTTAKLKLEDKNKASANTPVFKMDLTLKADQRAFLRGQGLEAELEGKVSIKGTLNRSHYSGQFKTVRGHYEILGKRFELQDGWVRFEDNQVVLLINGLHKAKDADIRAQLAGSLDKLALLLTSDPVMPEDEIISHLLFGKSARNISPLQAIRLAAAVNKLRTGGQSLFDPIEATRNLIGVDTLSIDSSETENGNGVSVGVGKYVSEKVYIELGTDTGAAQPWKGSVEIEVAPNLSVESTTGGDSGLGGIELQWKHDY